MCLTIPGKIVSITGNNATIETTNARKDIDISALPQATIGDWVLFSAGMAVRKISQEDAAELIKLLATPQL